MEGITRDEFHSWMERLHDDVRECREYLRSQNGRLAVVETKVVAIETQNNSDKTARVTGIGAVITSVSGLVWQWFKG